MRAIPVLAGAVVLALLQPPATPAHAHNSGHRIDLELLSSAPDQVSGGDALVRVTLGERARPGEVRITRNGQDVTGAFAVDPGGRSLTGLVDGLRLGRNELRARAGHGPTARLTLRNHPIEGPIFSGPKQYPFLCRTEQAGLGQPLIDNQDGEGMRVYALDEAGNKTDQVLGWSRDCSAETRIDYLYRTTSGELRPLPADGSVPADLAQTTTMDGKLVDFVVRRERGTINRFIYQIAMLAPLSEALGGPGPDHSSWNGRVIYVFSGGVAIGHDQGTIPGAATDPGALGLGYALIFSTGTRTNVHYNLVLGGETALMLKEHFIERHGVPRYTVGVGGSGGAIQQYIYGQNYGRRLLDAAIPQYSYPDMVTQTIHVGDCELLEYYMDVTDAGNPKWRDWENRTALIGMNASATVPNPYTGQLGSDECVNGWRGLTPLALNPNWAPIDPLWEHMDPPGVAETVHWTHWDDLRTIYGVDPATGYARDTWDNTGVQYGLQALREGVITPAEFLDLNAQIGSWKDQPDMVDEGCPFNPELCADPAQFDPWSARNLRLSPDGGQTPAPRQRGDRAAIRAVHEAGLVFTGDIDIPIIDWRHYLEEQLDMHNSRQSFVVRQRMLDHDGHAGNQVIWFTDARPEARFDQTPEALAVIDQWLANIEARPWRGVAGNKPADAVDRCFDTDGNEIARGDRVWDGILNHRPAGACTRLFPIYGTARTVAGAPFTGDVYACQLQPVRAAIARGVYGDWQPTRAERERLEEIFPTGVCRY
ncbi:MAG TPA: DUF6351 family protein [Natronosporangium sp.]